MSQSDNKLLAPGVAEASENKSASLATGKALAPEEQLSGEDLARVEKYLSSPIHQVERKPFRPWLMILMLISVMTFFSGLSLLIAWLVVD